VETYFAAVQRKVLTPNDFHSLAQSEEARNWLSKTAAIVRGYDVATPISWRSLMIWTTPSLRSSRNSLMVFGLIVLGAYCAYQAAEAIVANNLAKLAYPFMFFVGGGVVIAILDDWRRGLYIFVSWILFEDLVRKFLGNNMGIYFAKDILVLVLYLSFFRASLARRGGTFRIPFRLALLAFFWLALLQVFNPASTSIFYGILGMKLYFLYVPLIYMGYALIQSDEALHRFCSFLCVLTLVVAGLGIAQSIIGPDFLNPLHPQEDIRQVSTLYRAAPISGLVAYRPTSVFVSAGRFQDFLVVAWSISLGFGGYLLLRSRRGRTLAFTTIGVVAAASLMCASRGVLLWNCGTALLTATGFLWGANWRPRGTVGVLRAIQRSALFVGIGILLLVTIFPQEFAARVAIYSETLLPSSPASELGFRSRTYPLQELGHAFDFPAWPYGYGTGTTSLGIQYVIRIMHAAPMRVGVESGFGNFVVELGVLGLILWIILGLSISLSAWKVAKELRGTPWFPLAFAIFLFACVLFFPMTYTSFSAYQDFVINSNLWLLLGILYRLQSFPPTRPIAQDQAYPQRT